MYVEQQPYNRALIEASVDAQFAIAPDGTIADVNAEASHLTGYSRDDLVGSRFPTYFTDPDQASAGIHRTLADARIIGHELVLIARQAQRIAVSFNAGVIRDSAGTPLGILAAMRDITGQKTLERRLLDSNLAKDRFLNERATLALLSTEVSRALIECRTLQPMLARCASALARRLEAAFVRIWTLNPSEDVLELRASAGMYTHADGAHGRVPVGKFKIGLIARERQPHLTNAVIGDPRVGDQEWAQREGMISFAGYPLLVEDRLVGVMAMFARHPLTDAALEAMSYVANGIAVGIERISVEEALRAAHAELERRVESRTAELVAANTVLQGERLELEKAQQQLRAAREEAVQASRAKSEFLATMSHELRTPLNGVIGMSELLLRTAMTPDQRRFTRMARTSADTLLRLIDDILDFSKIEAGKLELECIDFNLRSTFERLTEAFSAAAQAKGLKLEFQIDGRTPVRVRGDPVRLQQVLTNLISNALKFTHEGQVRVQVVPEGESGRDTTFRFTVADTGIGVAQERLPRLFQSFSQGDASTTRKYGGSGLGLAISKRLVDLMGGEIGVKSEAGKGSEFWFVVALGLQSAASESGDAGAPRAEPQATPQAPRTTRGACILLAEDHEVSQEVASTILREAGYHCDVVSSGRQAIEAFRRGRYDIILMDCQMPEMDGYAATAEIRRDEPTTSHRSRIPIIALTANAVKGDRDLCLQAGMDDYLSKPLDPDRLIATIESHLAHSRGGPAPTAPAAHETPAHRTEPATSRPESPPPPFHMEQLCKQWGGDAGFVTALIKKFQKHAAADVERIAASVAARDAAETARLAHGLKGSAGYLAAMPVRELAAKLETMGRGEDLSGADECLAALQFELERCLSYEAPPSKREGIPDQDGARRDSRTSGATSGDGPAGRAAIGGDA